MWWNPLVFTLQCCTEPAPHPQQQRRHLIHSERKKNTKVSTHQLIIHYAFKASTAAPRHHGNCRLSCHTMVEHHIWLRLFMCFQWQRRTTAGQESIFILLWTWWFIVTYERRNINIHKCVCVQAASMRVLHQTHSLCCLIPPACRRISVFLWVWRKWFVVDLCWSLKLWFIAGAVHIETQQVPHMRVFSPGRLPLIS